MITSIPPTRSGSAGEDMLVYPKRSNLQKIVVLNPKGGSGKSTVATNLASYFALRGPLPALLDCDPQGFCMRWLERRSPGRAPIHGIAAYGKPFHATKNWQLRVPNESTRLIVDTPAALESPQIHDLTYDADLILIPVMPSPIDIRFAARFIAELLMVAQLDRGDRKLGIIANRSRVNTLSLRELMRFLTSLKIPIISTLRDSQNYVKATDRGIGIYEMPHYQSHRDIADFSRIIAWLEEWQPVGRRIASKSPPVVEEKPVRPLH